MNTVFHPIPADFADDITGATIKATTAGRIPLNIAEIVSLFFIRSGLPKDQETPHAQSNGFYPQSPSR